MSNIKIIVERFGQKEGAGENIPKNPRGIIKRKRADDYLPRRLQKGKTVWSFFDLGTRLQSVAAPSDYANGYRAIEATDSPNPQAGYYSEYVEIHFDAPGKFDGYLEPVPFDPGDPMALSTSHIQVAAADAAAISLIESWDEKILGARAAGAADTLDPFGKSLVNGTHSKIIDGVVMVFDDGNRFVPNCMPIWYGRSDQTETLADYNQSRKYPNEVFDLEVFTVNPETLGKENIKTYVNAKLREIVGNLTDWWFDPAVYDPNPSTQAIWDLMVKIPNVLWSFRQRGADEEDNERWNPLNLQKDAQMEFKGESGKKQIKLNTKLFYESFDTSDTTNFKVTNLPSFSAPSVEFVVDNGKEAQFYLKPSWLAYMRKFAWSYGRRITFETYRGSFYFGSPRVNLQNGIGAANANYYWQDNPNFDSEAGPFEFTGTFHIDRQTGAGYHTTHDGVINFQCELLSDYDDPSAPSYTLYYLYKGPNYSVSYLEYVDKYVAPGGYRRRIDADWNDGNFPTRYEDDDCSLEIYWQSETLFPSAFGTVYRGVHIGRSPVFPHTTDSRWYSTLSYLGENPYEYTSADGTTTFAYDPAVAATKKGLIDFLLLPNFNDYYNRHESKDAVDMMYGVQRIRFGIPAESGQEDTDFTSTGGVQIGDEVPSGTGLPGWATQTTDQITSLLADIEALPHVRNAVMDASYENQSFRDLNAADILPIDAPAELLVGCVLQGDNVFYIWRRTAEDRGGLDYDRNQAVW